MIPLFVHDEPTDGDEPALRSGRLYDDPTATFLRLVHVTVRREGGHLDNWSPLLGFDGVLDKPVLVTDNARVLFTPGTRWCVSR
jgi:hypothetical protein